MSSRSSVDRVPTRCSGGQGFNSCRWLRIFLCPTLVSCWLIHLHISLPTLKFTIFINLSLTSITWPYRGLKFTAPWGHVFFWSWPLTKCWLSIGSRGHIGLACWKQGRIVQKPVYAYPGLKVNRIITFSPIQMLFAVLFSVYSDY